MPLKFRAIHEKIIPPCQPPWQPSDPSVWAQLQVAASNLQETRPFTTSLVQMVWIMPWKKTKKTRTRGFLCSRFWKTDWHWQELNQPKWSTTSRKNIISWNLPIKKCLVFRPFCKALNLPPSCHRSIALPQALGLCRTVQGDQSGPGWEILGWWNGELLSCFWLEIY